VEERVSEPLTVWDARDQQNYPGRSAEWLDAFHAWVEAHGIAIRKTWRIEHHLMDAPFIRVYQDDYDEKGRLRLDPETGDVIARKPFDVILTTPPPRPEDYA
jgi:hypothetical protein